MSYRLPVFNITCNIWRSANPTTNPPDVVSPCNLALGRRVTAVAGESFSGVSEPGLFFMWLLLPAGTDIRGFLPTATAGDVVEVPAGSGRFYETSQVDDAGKGFPNEHRVAAIWLDSTPYPMP